MLEKSEYSHPPTLLHWAQQWPEQAQRSLTVLNMFSSFRLIVRGFFLLLPLSDKPACWWTSLCVYPSVSVTPRNTVHTTDQNTCKATGANHKTSANTNTWNRQCHSSVVNPTCVWSGLKWNLDYVCWANKTIARQTEGGGAVNFSARRPLVKSCENCCVPVFTADWKEEGQTFISKNRRTRWAVNLVWSP